MNCKNFVEIKIVNEEVKNDKEKEQYINDMLVSDIISDISFFADASNDTMKMLTDSMGKITKKYKSFENSLSDDEFRRLHEIITNKKISYYKEVSK